MLIILFFFLIQSEDATCEEEVLFPFSRLRWFDNVEGTILICIWCCFLAYFLKSCVLVFIYDFLSVSMSFVNVSNKFCQVRLLDRHHLLIKFGSVDGGVRIFFLFLSLRCCLYPSPFPYMLTTRKAKSRPCYMWVMQQAI